MNFMPMRPLTLPAQRAVGRLALTFRPAAGRTRIETFYQEGCLKARLPRPQNETICEAVTLNISGGVAGGDALTTAITLAESAQVSIASQAAERIYRALDTPSRIATTITLAAGATLDYLPQETILFDGFSLDRTLDIDLAETADFLGVETLLFGRQKMGEILRAGHLRDRITLRRSNKLILQDMTRLNGNIATQLGRPGVANGAQAIATLIFAAPDAAKILPALRAVLLDRGLESGASLMDGVILARHLARDAAAARNCLIAAIRVCRPDRPLPRVWQG